ncbi:MAG: hypothetical protein HOP06_05800 [Methylotenera sp.]|nr:hypothetical protein [Methylotenera sp.]
MIKSILLSISIMLLLTGCPSMAWKPAPPQREILEGLANQNQIKISRNKITGASKLKLAIISSANVQPQIQAYGENVNQYKGLISHYSSDAEKLNADADIVFSDKLYLQAIISSLKSRFSETFYANDLASAFAKGADYAAVLDIRLEMIDLSNKYYPGPMMEDDIANIRTLFISKNLEGGPDVVVNNRIKDVTEGKGPEANIRYTLNRMKNVRLKSLKDFEAELSKVVIK